MGICCEVLQTREPELLTMRSRALELVGKLIKHVGFEYLQDNVDRLLTNVVAVEAAGKCDVVDGGGRGQLREDGVRLHGDFGGGREAVADPLRERAAAPQRVHAADHRAGAKRPRWAIYSPSSQICSTASAERRRTSLASWARTSGTRRTRR